MHSDASGHVPSGGAPRLVLTASARRPITASTLRILTHVRSCAATLSRGRANGASMRSMTTEVVESGVPGEHRRSTTHAPCGGRHSARAQPMAWAKRGRIIYTSKSILSDGMTRAQRKSAASCSSVSRVRPRMLGDTDTRSPSPFRDRSTSSQAR